MDVDIGHNDGDAAPEISFDEAVAEGKYLIAEGKRISASADRNAWRLAALADQVGTQYGEKDLAKFASEIGLAHCTIERRRSTYRNWKDILKADPGLLSSLSYSVARKLEKHPDRGALVKANPEMSKRDAADAMKTYRNKDETPTQRLWRDLLKRAGKATADETLFKLDREDLLDAVEQPSLNNIREGGQAWIRLADELEKLFDDADA